MDDPKPGTAAHGGRRRRQRFRAMGQGRGHQRGGPAGPQQGAPSEPALQLPSLTVLLTVLQLPSLAVLLPYSCRALQFCCRFSARLDCAHFSVHLLLTVCHAPQVHRLIPKIKELTEICNLLDRDLLSFAVKNPRTTTTLALQFGPHCGSSVELSC